jgi:PhzF family phenazine biosynthesis protein
MARRFKQVDVFTDRPFYGNPVAVVLDGEGIADDEMQRIAAWTNLSETTFVLPPPEAGAANYRLRIFAPQDELPFAGHPTIGSAHAVLESGILPPDTRSFRMECGAGILALHVEGEGPARRIFSQAPRARIVHEFSTSIEAISAALGAPVAADTPPVSIDKARYGSSRAWRTGRR